MRVAFLTSEFITEPNTFDGGLSNYIYKVSSELVKFGHESIVITSSFEDNYSHYKGINVYRVKPKNNLIYKIADKLSRFQYQLSLDLLLQSYYVNKKLRQIHKENPIDLVQFPSHHAIGFFIPSHIKSVMRISGYQKLADPANGLYYKSLKERQGQILEHKCYKRAKNIFGPSFFLAEIIAEKFQKTVNVIETPYNFEKLKYDNVIFNKIINITNGNKYGLYFGRLAQIKGLIEIANVLNSFFTKYPSYYFVIIGKDIGHKGKSSLNYILNKIENHNKDKLIYFKEQVHERLMPVISNSDFVLMPSRIENFPNACVEAMTLNKIVIATKGISFEQLINDKENGFLFKNANANDLLKVIEHVLSLSTAKKEEIERNAGITINRLHPDITVNKLIKYYETILKK